MFSKTCVLNIMTPFEVPRESHLKATNS